MRDLFLLLDLLLELELEPLDLDELLELVLRLLERDLDGLDDTLRLRIVCN